MSSSLRLRLVGFLMGPLRGAVRMRRGTQAWPDARADQIEAVQLGMGSEVLTLARHLLMDSTSTVDELRFAARRLSECLADALRVAESRGRRLRSRPQS